MKVITTIESAWADEYESYVYSCIKCKQYIKIDCHITAKTFFPNLTYSCCDIDHIVYDLENSHILKDMKQFMSCKKYGASAYRPLTFDAAAWLKINHIKPVFFGIFDIQELKLIGKFFE